MALGFWIRTDSKGECGDVWGYARSSGPPPPPCCRSIRSSESHCAEDVTVTNDGATILEKMDVQHQAGATKPLNL